MIESLIRNLTKELIMRETTVVEDWQSINVGEETPRAKTRELENVMFTTPTPQTIEDAQAYVDPNLPWAEDHFQERVSGKPLNPPPSAVYWPFAVGGNKEHMKDEKFSHSYPERFWPKKAGTFLDGDEFVTDAYGIRYPYGDLDDVVQQLVDKPHTRQAYLPVWFPEDTGVVHGERVPCTLGYHFLIREGKMNMTYLIRSCDLLRHFRDDLYMAMRLHQWVADKVGPVPVGKLTMHMMSLHIFEADVPMIEQKKQEIDRELKAPYN